MAQFTLDGVTYSRFRDIPGAVYTRSGVEYQQNAAGVLVPFDNDVPPISANVGVDVWQGATNLLLRSQEFDNAAWLKSGVTVTADAAVAPDGTTTADLLNAGVGNSDHASESIEVSVTSGSTYTLSVHAKAGTESLLVLWNSQNGSMGTVNLLTGAVTGGVTAQALGNGWYRAQATFTASSTTSRIVRFYVKSTAVYTGSNETLYLWGAQLEAGSFATSYIPTTTAAVTRNADVLVSADTVISPTIVAEFTVPANGGASPFPWAWGWDDGTSNNRAMLVLNRSTLNLRLQIDAGGVQQAYVDLGTLVAGSTYKIAARLAVNDVAASKNGAAVVTDVNVTLPVVSTFRLGRGPGGNEWGAGLRRIRRYSTAKTNAELQALSA